MADGGGQRAFGWQQRAEAEGNPKVGGCNDHKIQRHWYLEYHDDAQHGTGSHWVDSWSPLIGGMTINSTPLTSCLLDDLARLGRQRLFTGLSRLALQLQLIPSADEDGLHPLNHQLGRPSTVQRGERIQT